MIDSSGGIVEVSDPNSPLYGTSVEFLEDALTTGETIQIVHHSQSPAVPADAASNGPTVGLRRSGQGSFAKAAIVRLPITEAVPEDDEYFDVVTYDEGTGQWVRVESWHAYEEGKMLLLLPHFSKYRPLVRRTKIPGETWTNFNMHIDSMEFQNPPRRNPDYCSDLGGLCHGIAVATEWFFWKYGHGLRCYYNWDSAQRVACDVQRDATRTFGGVLSPAIELTPQLSSRLTCHVLWQALYRGEPVTTSTLNMWPPHAIVVFAWVPTGPSDWDGYFWGYDVNDHSWPIKVISHWDFDSFYNPCKLYLEFYPSSIILGSSFGLLSEVVSDVEDIIKRHPPDNVCTTNPNVAGTWTWRFKWANESWGQNTLLLRRDGIWINQTHEGISGKWNVQGLQLTLDFHDPTWPVRAQWRGALNPAMNSVSGGTMTEWDNYTGSQTRTGVWTASK